MRSESAFQTRNSSPSCGFKRRAAVVSCSASPNVQNPFGSRKELNGLSKTLVDLPKAALYAGAFVFVAAAGAIGSVIGSKAPESARNVGRIAGAAAGAVAGAAAVSSLQGRRVNAAGVLLHNAIVDKDDPSSLTREEVAAIGEKVGANLSVKLVGELKRVYDAFLESTLPPGDLPLKGDEADRIRAFKEALGLADEDAAPVHIDVGRRIMRSRFEAGSRRDSSEQFRGLQKLIYVSDLVFGAQKAAFLLPWRRVFNLSDSSLYVARRENAKALFRSYIDSRGGVLQANRASLAELKAFQEKVRLEDEIAEEAVKEAARAHVEAVLERGIEATKRRTRVRDYSDVVKAVKEALAYSRALASLADDPTLPKGLGPVSIFGGRLESSGRELRELFRIYLEESLKTAGEFTDALEDDLADAQKLLALGPREAEDIRSEIVSKTYKRLLREEFASGRLDAAPSKAEVLGQLCDRLNFDDEAAAQLHKQLYSEKLTSLVEKKKITEEDSTELDRLRRLLCIPKADVQQLHKEICGRIYQEVVEDAMRAGIDRFGFAEREAVEKSQKDLRLDESIAAEILDSVSRRAFLAFVSRSRTKSNRLDAAKELKALVFFSNIVVSPLLEDLKKDELAAKKAKQTEAEEAQKKIAEMMVKAQEQMVKDKAKGEGVNEAEEADADEPAAIRQWKEMAAADKKAEAATADSKATAEAASAEDAQADASAAPAADEEMDAEDRAAKEAAEQEAVATLRKSQEAAKDRESGEEVGSTGVMMKSQKDITLKNDLDARDRLDIYRNFLLYCMSGDVVALPMGSTVVVERDSSEFARLSQLGDILGLSPIEIGQVHSQLAEQAYRSQVQSALGTGVLSKEKADQLAEVRDKMGLSKEAAEKIIKGVQNQHLISGLQAAKATGQLTLQKVLDMQEAGVEVESFVSEDMRLQMYTKEVAEVLSNGTGEFDSERLLEELPTALHLPERKVKAAIETQAGDRKRNVLVQAVSLLRQRKLDDVVKSLNNLLACNKAMPSDKPAEWREKEELQDLYSVYVGRESDADKAASVASMLGISDSEAASLKDLVASGEFKLEQEVEDDRFF
ncbi:g7829 [Coccomyxa elongata]